MSNFVSTYTISPSPPLAFATTTTTSICSPWMPPSMRAMSTKQQRAGQGESRRRRHPGPHHHFGGYHSPGLDLACWSESSRSRSRLAGMTLAMLSSPHHGFLLLDTHQRKANNAFHRRKSRKNQPASGLSPLSTRYDNNGNDDGPDDDDDGIDIDNDATEPPPQEENVVNQDIRFLNKTSMSSYNVDDDDDDDDDNNTNNSFSLADDYNRSSRKSKDDLSEEEFLQRELNRLEQLEEILAELEEFATPDDDDDDDDLDDDEGNDDRYDYSYDLDQLEEDVDFVALDQDVLLKELLESFPDDDDSDGDNGVRRDGYSGRQNTEQNDDRTETEALSLEAALLQGVVPADAGVGSGQLPGDYGFDPLNVSTRDYIQAGQEFVSNLLLPFSSKSLSASSLPQVQQQRPSALILRDYREAEIRHGRLAMLAAMIWPLQEMLDQFILTPDQFGSLLFGKVTLPYFPLFMTAVMLLLGYLDIYSAAIKDMDQIGEAFLPGDCFWDPLSVLEGAPPRMKRNMQERELFNGRMAMLAFAMFVWEETATRKALISIPANELLFKPLYQVSFIQEYLDAQFSHQSLSLDYLPDS